jgi:hypothetical protein
MAQCLADSFQTPGQSYRFCHYPIQHSCARLSQVRRGNRFLWLEDGVGEWSQLLTAKAASLSLPLLTRGEARDNTLVDGNASEGDILQPTRYLSRIFTYIIPHLENILQLFRKEVSCDSSAT